MSRFSTNSFKTARQLAKGTGLASQVVTLTPPDGTTDFTELYRLRWGIETFYATIYLTGIESVLTDAAQTQLNGSPPHSQTVNRVVSFNVIKNTALDLLYSTLDTDALLAQLTTLFLKNPTSLRSERNPPRQKSSLRAFISVRKSIAFKSEEA